MPGGPLGDPEQALRTGWEPASECPDCGVAAARAEAGPGRQSRIESGLYDFPVAAPRKCVMALAITPSKWMIESPTAASVAGALNAI